MYVCVCVCVCVCVHACVCVCVHRETEKKREAQDGGLTHAHYEGQTEQPEGSMPLAGHARP